MKEIKTAEEEGCNYVGLGAVFSSKTKRTLEPIGRKALKEASSSTKLPCFAIGGINDSNIEQVKDTGIYRVAIADAIINPKKIIKYENKRYWN